MKKLILFVLISIISNSSFSQKTSIWFNHSITSPHSSTHFSKGKNSSNTFPIGFGLGFHISHTIGKKQINPFSIEYGFLFKSVRQSYIFGNYQLWSNTGGLYIPISGKYLLTLKDHHKFVFRLGVNNLLQMESFSSGGEGGKYSFDITKKAGIFPLMKFGLGYHWGKKLKFEICLHANLGFIRTQTIKIKHASTEVTNEFNGSYFELEFNLKLNKKKKEEFWED